MCFYYKTNIVNTFVELSNINVSTCLSSFALIVEITTEMDFGQGNHLKAIGRDNVRHDNLAL